VIAFLLRNLGHQVELAEDGEKGIEVFTKLGNFDLVSQIYICLEGTATKLPSIIRSSERAGTRLLQLRSQDEVQKDMFNFSLLKPSENEELITIIRSLEHK